MISTHNTMMFCYEMTYEEVARSCFIEADPQTMLIAIDASPQKKDKPTTFHTLHIELTNINIM